MEEIQIRTIRWGNPAFEPSVWEIRISNHQVGKSNFKPLGGENRFKTIPGEENRDLNHQLGESGFKPTGGEIRVQAIR